MKRLITGLVLTFGMCLYVGAQGQITFQTFGGGVVAPVTNALTGAQVTGANYFAGLFYGPAGTAETALRQAGASATFNPVGYVTSSTGGGVRLTDPTWLDANQSGLFQVRAWSAVLGNDYAAALTTWLGGSNPTAVLGKSNIIPQTPTASPSPAPVLTGLTAFNLVPVPEPSVIALGALGLVAVLWRRRK